MQTRLNVLRGGRGNQNWIVTARLVKSIIQAICMWNGAKFSEIFPKNRCTFKNTTIIKCKLNKVSINFQQTLFKEIFELSMIA